MRLNIDSFLKDSPSIKKDPIDYWNRGGKYTHILTVVMVIFIFFFMLVMYSPVYLMYSTH